MQSKTLTYLFICLFSLCSVQTQAQMTSVHGTVYDEQNGETLPFVTIQVPETNGGTRADIDGNFL
jgi:CarboxypepD_reg-like domain